MRVGFSGLICLNCACKLAFRVLPENGRAVNTNFKVIGLTRLGIKPTSTAPEADALTTWPSELCHIPIPLSCDHFNQRSNLMFRDSRISSLLTLSKKVNSPRIEMNHIELTEAFRGPIKQQPTVTMLTTGCFSGVQLFSGSTAQGVCSNCFKTSQATLKLMLKTLFHITLH